MLQFHVVNIIVLIFNIVFKMYKINMHYIIKLKHAQNKEYSYNTINNIYKYIMVITNTSCTVVLLYIKILSGEFCTFTAFMGTKKLLSKLFWLYCIKCLANVRVTTDRLAAAIRITLSTCVVTSHDYTGLIYWTQCIINNFIFFYTF